MNTRLMYILLAVQFLFAGSLLYLGTQVRENRRQGYLELTHRVTSGFASKADFEKLIQFIPERAERPQIRALFGPPLVRASRVEIEGAGKPTVLEGDSWLYYISPVITDPENPPPPLDAPDVATLTGPHECFVVTFNERGRATAQIAKIRLPLPAEPLSPPRQP